MYGGAQAMDGARRTDNKDMINTTRVATNTT